MAWHDASRHRRASMRHTRDALRTGFYRSADTVARLVPTRAFHATH